MIKEIVRKICGRYVLCNYGNFEKKMISGRIQIKSLLQLYNFTQKC